MRREGGSPVTFPPLNDPDADDEGGSGGGKSPPREADSAKAARKDGRDRDDRHDGQDGQDGQDRDGHDGAGTGPATMEAEGASSRQIRDASAEGPETANTKHDGTVETGADTDVGDTSTDAADTGTVARDTGTGEGLEKLIEQVDLDELEDPGQTDRQGEPVPSESHTLEAAVAVDEAIPMLTEVVQVPRYDTEDLPQTFAEVDWSELSQRVRENVLERLLRRSDALLDAQLQSTLGPVLERAADTVAHELQDALNRMIRDIVSRAVTEELTRLHAEIAKRNRSPRSIP